jgi:hypothetical protein
MVDIHTDITQTMTSTIKGYKVGDAQDAGDAVAIGYLKNGLKVVIQHLRGMNRSKEIPGVTAEAVKDATGVYARDVKANL